MSEVLDNKNVEKQENIKCVQNARKLLQGKQKKVLRGRMFEFSGVSKSLKYRKFALPGVTQNIKCSDKNCC